MFDPSAYWTEIRYYDLISFGNADLQMQQPHNNIIIIHADTAFV